MIDPDLTWIAAATLAVILGQGAVRKLGDLVAFRAAFENYRILPAAFALPSAVLLPMAEATAAGLLLPALRGAGAVLAVLLLGTVSGGLAINLARGRREIDCGCGGAGQPISGALLWRNAALLALAGMAALEPPARALTASDAALVVAGTLMWAGLYFTVDRLVANWALFR